MVREIQEKQMEVKILENQLATHEQRINHFKEQVMA